MNTIEISVSEIELKNFAKSNNLPVGLLKQYAKQMQYYKNIGATYGDNTYGFLKWLGCQKKAVI